MRKKILSRSVVAVAGLLLLLMGAYVFADWSAPASSPPTCVSGNPGCDPPIHTGLTGQVKQGGLTVGANSGVVNGLLVPFGKVGIGTAAPQSALHVPDGKYAQFEDNNAGAPPSADCNDNAERGRMSIDTNNNRLYICNGATRGWDYVSLN